MDCAGSMTTATARSQDRHAGLARSRPTAAWDCIRYPRAHVQATMRSQMEWANAIQWPAMIVTLLAAWLVASKRQKRRNFGFWVFILSNVLWIAWGWHVGSYALILLQVGLFAMNLRGARENPG